MFTGLRIFLSQDRHPNNRAFCDLCRRLLVTKLNNYSSAINFITNARIFNGVSRVVACGSSWNNAGANLAATITAHINKVSACVNGGSPISLGFPLPHDT